MLKSTPVLMEFKDCGFTTATFMQGRQTHVNPCVHTHTHTDVVTLKLTPPVKHTQRLKQ